MKWTFQHVIRCVEILCALLVGCGTPEVIADEKPKTPDFTQRGDLEPRRLRNRPSVTLPAIGKLYADRVDTSKDGTVMVRGRVYLDVENQTSDTTQGWPRHAYADEVKWEPTTQTLELKGWPILEYRRMRIIPKEAGCRMTLSPGATRTEGPTSTLLKNLKE